MTRPIEVRAHAKLTWSLRVIGRRSDGYHLLDAEMVSLELHDLLTMDPSRQGLAATGPFAAGLALDDSNLVARALRLADRTAHVTIDKRIPHGGGLGGGSADAAAVLRWAGFGTAESQLIIASRLGADIPFCLVGGRAHVGGIGEELTPLPHLDRTVTLIVPPLHVSTPAVYRALDQLGNPPGDSVNHLEPAALVVEPRLRWWRDAIGERVGSAPTLAGSGATWFVEGDHERVVGDLTGEGATILATRTIDAERAQGARE